MSNHKAGFHNKSIVKIQLNKFYFSQNIIYIRLTLNTCLFET